MDWVTLATLVISQIGSSLPQKRDYMTTPLIRIPLAGIRINGGPPRPTSSCVRGRRREASGASKMGGSVSRSVEPGLQKRGFERKQSGPSFWPSLSSLILKWSGAIFLDYNMFLMATIFFIFYIYIQDTMLCVRACVYARAPSPPPPPFLHVSPPSPSYILLEMRGNAIDSR